MDAVTRAVRVVFKVVEARDICSFELAAIDGETLPPFSAGAHIDVYLPAGLTRQYSLCNNPSERHRYQIAVLRDTNSRGGSTAMHALEVGQTIHVSDPKNHFPLVHDAHHSVLLAGGIGITPLLCMAEHLASLGTSFELHYCTRSADRAAFLERIRASPFAGRVHLHYDDGPPSQKLDLAAVLERTRSDVHLYVCGPTGFMDWSLETARTTGWPEERLHREYFAAAPIDTSTDGSFDVQMASTGKVIRVDAHQTVVAALSAHGVSVPTSCEQGVCGACLTRVLEGIPEHRDMFLTVEEQARGDQFTPCCSRSKSPKLVVDL
ncbi:MULTISPECIES: PDR/VanB family oxidoreductase [Paraburkholderia]|uniref:Oxidoreductase n=1 Tax=Paraburkholderia dipogonis TaxID=1211383 RepID=A0A4Y8MH13_9BURK|nr:MULTISPECIES: PDR/VanB family oxidoreductase [Paraburkholderia]RKR31336.1 vanillate O-demethylase ferredoxin subunit [Paraburkholderia sp. BL17N1]TFE36695.1 oxidoreductase [Paraburkholderia dipogonis]